MEITKTCDECNKEIKNKTNDNLGYSEWCVFHFKKRRDFCSDKCFLRFVMKKLVLDKKEEKE